MDDQSNQLVSPNDLFEAGKRVMLDGRDPVSNKDWAKLLNFVAYNVMREIAQSATMIFAKIYGCPLDEETVRSIVAYQQMIKFQENAEMN